MALVKDPILQEILDHEAETLYDDVEFIDGVVLHDGDDAEVGIVLYRQNGELLTHRRIACGPKPKVSLIVDSVKTETRKRQLARHGK